MLNKVVYTDRELNSLIGTELRSIMIDSQEDVLRTNKLEKVTKMIISLNELDNSDNLEDGRPSNTLFTYHVTGPEYFMRFKPRGVLSNMEVGGQGPHIKFGGKI